MALKYNRDTAVERDIKTQNQTDYTYYSDNNIEQQSQNELISYSNDGFGDGDHNQTVTSDFVATQAQLSVRCGDNASTGAADAIVYINGEIVAVCKVESQAGESKANSISVPLPNIIVRTGYIINFWGSVNDGACGGAVIGYAI